jgi:hypothetical protein
MLTILLVEKFLDRERERERERENRMERMELSIQDLNLGDSEETNFFEANRILSLNFSLGSCFLWANA